MIQLSSFRFLRFRKMPMKKFFNLFHVIIKTLACFMMLFSPFSLQADNSLSLGVTLNGAVWSGDNGSGRSTFSSTEGGQFGLSANVNLDRFYVGISLQGGNYSFDSDAPDQFTSNGAVTAQNTDVEHSDFDLLGGYYFWPQVSLFVDLKGAGSKWKNNGYEQNFGGLGLGVSAYHPLNQDWLLFGTLGFVNGKIKDDAVSNLGDGKSGALTLGSAYSIAKNHQLNFGFKYRIYRFDFDDGNRQDYTLNSIFVGYAHILRW